MSVVFQTTSLILLLLAAVQLETSARSFDPSTSVDNAVSFALTATTITTSIAAVGVEPGRTTTYSCAAISAIAELLSDFVQQK